MTTPESNRPAGGPSARRLLLSSLFVLVLFALVIARRPDEPKRSTTEEEQVVKGTAFGTTYMVRWGGPTQPELVRSAVDEVVTLVNASMSTYHPTSELSRFNRSLTIQSVTISASLTTVMASAFEIHNRTDGAFDPTVGPIVNLWGFGPKSVINPPSASALEQASRLVGLEKVQMSDGSMSPVHLRKTHPKLQIDLSAIAKGYAVDAAFEALGGLGLTQYLVEIGGEVRVSGRGPERPWRVGIERPEASASKTIEEVITLRDKAMATSGNYRNFVTVDGLRVTHIIDPRRGQPVSHGLGSVSVLASTCMEADALATALYVLGPEDGLEWANKNGVAALFLTVNEGSLQRVASQEFKAHTQKGVGG